MLALEKTVSREILDNVRKTLTPYLGLRNFQISVAARLNTDKKQTNETIFNPDSRVERSVRVVKQNQLSQNSSNSSPATVQRNLPQENPSTNDGKQSNEENRKQEELTNYELSSKTISTVSGGYGIDNLSVAVLVNRASLLASLGGTKAVERRMSELQQLVATAAGTRSERGPEDLLAMLREKLAAFSGAIDFSLDDSIDVRIVADQTKIESRIGAWVERIKSLPE
jgi:flagellar M-ring protein FliF